MRTWRTGAEVLRDRLAARRSQSSTPDARRLAAATADGDAQDEAARETPAYVAERLAELRLLHDVPFQYVVPDPALAPIESIRFFHLDDWWTDALAEGALSVDGTGDEPATGRPAFARSRRARDRAVAGVRDRRRGRPADVRETGPVTGFLLRSSAVARWPGMQVRAYAGSIPPDVDPDEAPDGVRLRLLRLEQVAPSVLLALFDGVPTLVVVEQPPGGVVLGISVDQAGDWRLPLRTREGELIEDDDEAVDVAVPLRPGGKELGVVDVTALREELEEAAESHPEMPQVVSPAVLALALVRPPRRQRFGAPGNI